jgi:predicted ATPase
LRSTLAETLETIEYVRTMGIRVSLPVVLCRLAEAYGMSANPGKGLAAISEALAEVEATAQPMCQAELYRVKGELLLIQNASDSPQAEQAFRTATDVARRQQARFCELLATIRLAGLLNNQAKRDEARSVLAEIYGWFTEGFDTADLKDAKALLDDLNQ